MLEKKKNYLYTKVIKRVQEINRVLDIGAVWKRRRGKAENRTQKQKNMHKRTSAINIFYRNLYFASGVIA